MSSKKSKKKASVKLASLPRVYSLSELMAVKAFELEAGRNGDERFAAFAADVDFLKESYAILSVEGNPDLREWASKLGVTQVATGLLGSTEAYQRFSKLVKGFGLIEPQLLQAAYRKVSVPPVPFLFTPEVDEKVFERSEAFEHVILHGVHYTKENGPGSGGSSYITTKVGTRYQPELVFDSADADTEVQEGFQLPYARARGDFSIVGWKDNVSFCSKVVEGPKAPSNGNPGKSGDVLTYTGKDGEDRKVLAVYVARQFPTQETYVSEEGYEKVRQLAPARLLSDVVQLALKRALSNGGTAWNQFRALVDASKQFNLAMRERTVGEARNGRTRVWTMKVGPLTLFSAVAFKDLPESEQKKLTHQWAVQHEIRTKLEELTNLQAALDLPLNKGNHRLAAELGDKVRDLHKRIVTTESFWAFKQLKPWYSIVFASDAPVSFDDLI